MTSPEVLIVGAGPAGIASALRLARAGVRVLVLEGASFAGAENWSGCVYHADGLLRPDVLGAELWREAPVERRIVARSLFVHDGIAAAGFEARANAGNDYGEAWTVLRPKLDRWLAARAIDFGVTLLPGTTVTGLRYDGERVVGVNTERGPIEAPVVFLSEGDAAGLLAREGLERVSRPHFAQGIKAVFQLPAGEIERRFGVAPREGVAQEWLIRNGELAGRAMPLDATAFLYTNSDSLSLGLALPLDRLAAHGPADHPHLLKRVLALPGVNELLAGAEQVAYGAKVIRAGGLNETPHWVRDGLAIGGGALGLGMEFPYPNFIGPAITTGLCFADAVLELRGQGAEFDAPNLERAYSQRVRASDDYANAGLLRHWPGAIHAGPLLFEQLPALIGQFVAAQAHAPAAAQAQCRRALAAQFMHISRDLSQAVGFVRGLTVQPPPEQAVPLDVRFFAIDAEGPRSVAADAEPLLQLSAAALGHFYGRRQRDMRVRLALMRQALRPHALGTAASVARLGLGAIGGGAGFVRDLAAYKLRRLPLRTFLTRPYHAHASASERALAWLVARRTPASPTGWLAPMDRRRPDVRHITLPLVDGAAAQQLRNVCPAEVYSVTSLAGGAASQYENCIKCESCRVTVPGIDWNRTSHHRLAYRVPGDGRYGFDGSIRAELALPQPANPFNDPDRALLESLLASLAARPPQVGPDAGAVWQGLVEKLSPDTPGALRARLRDSLARHAYGHAQTELAAWLGPVPPPSAAVRSEEEHAQRKRAHAWQRLREFFTPERLRDLSRRAWAPEERQTLLAWIDAARDTLEDAVEWLARWSPALAWAAANHYLAEASAGRELRDALTAVVARLPDGASAWVPGVARYIDPGGKPLDPGAPIAHGAGLDAVQPVRFAVPASAASAVPTSATARLALALALGMAQSLRERALDYANGRVQFRGELKDVEGRDSIAKFGAVKAMLAGIEQTVHLLDAARDACAREPLEVLALIQARMGLRTDAVPWMAGQIFGGMAYSEDDILAPRYRDAFVLSQWPGGAELDPGAARHFALRLVPRRTDAVLARNLATFTAAQLARPEIAPEAADHSRAPVSRMTARRGGALGWPAGAKFTYRSGDFLGGSLLPPDRLLTPEHFRRDPRLRRTRAEVLRLMRRGFRSPNKGEHYGRYIDALHGVPPDDVERLRAFNAFATIIPAALGGKGWSKADYAVLNMLTMGRGDTSLGLLIMASTSIGTMPVLLGLEQDLPRLERELTVCLADPEPWAALASEIEGLLAALAHPEPKRLKAAFTRLGERAQRMFMGRGSTLKYLARDFLLALQSTVETAKSRDLDALAIELARLQEQLPPLRATLVAERSALPQRRAAHERFLRFLGTGQISAFALTEPGAGSDTGGVQCRAVLRTAAAVSDDLGFYRFTPHGSDEPRILLDAQRLLFDGRVARYRLASGELGVLDDGGWDLARNSGERCIRTPQARYVFHDIGVVQTHGDGWIYAYWELTGNKMWITNGSVADRYCLYAQTESGETGFMLERRSEGLRIGPNEHKLGQRASPTNELTLAGVRVSADQVIGFRGHGQVNALETLSVGRGGLVTGCATMLERLLGYHRELWARHPDDQVAAQFELDRLQTLAARLVGLMDRADLAQGDFRIEAALSKYLASEGLHRVLGWLERIRGPMSAATEELIEKLRRDARILNIYEGTNEVQRFLVLKDLPNLLAGLADEQAVATGDNELDSALRVFRDFTAPRLAALGAGVWTHPDEQVRWFPVVEWAGELYVWCALRERVRLLETRNDPADRFTIRRLLGVIACQAAQVARVASHVQGDFARAGTAEDAAAATLGIARAMLRAPDTLPAAPVCVGGVQGVWTVVLRSRLEWNGGRAVWCGWHAADLAVLDRLLAWRDASPGLAIRVAALVPPGFDDHLRRLQAAGAEVVQLNAPLGIPDPIAVAQSLAHVWPDTTRVALGARAGNAHDASFAHALAGALACACLSGVAAVGSCRRGDWIEDRGFARHHLARKRRALFVWDLAPDGRSDAFDARAWLAALRQPPVPAIDLPAVDAAAQPLAAAGVEDVPAAFETPAQLAAWLRRRLRAAGDEPRAPVREATPAPAPVVWITSAAGLARLRTRPALALLQDLALPFAVLAIGGETPPAIARDLARPACTGVWLLPGDPSPDAIVRAVAALPGTLRYAVVDRELAIAAGALAAGRGWRLDASVVALGQRVQLRGEDVQCERPAAERVVLIPDDGYGSAMPRISATAVAVATLPVAPRAPALSRWQARAGTRPAGLADASLVIDVGFGAADGNLYETVVLPLRAALENFAGRRVELGATRKITQDAKLLAPAHQIGQTGLAIAPELVLALGVSGAPQHMSGIGRDALVIAVNRDPDAPIFHWHRDHRGPRIIRCLGDLREWLPPLVAALNRDGVDAGTREAAVPADDTAVPEKAV